MNDFHFCNQTMIHFGKGMIKEISSELKNYGKNILLVYGGGSIKKNGIYDEIIEILKGCERSEERRVGEVCRSWWLPEHLKKK